MARIYNQEQAGVTFQSSAQATPYAPVSPYDPSDAIRQRGQQEVEDAKTLGRAIAQQNALNNNILQQNQAVQRSFLNANQQALQGLLSLAPSAMKAVTAVKEIEIENQTKQQLVDDAFGVSTGTFTTTESAVQQDTNVQIQRQALAEANNKVAADVEKQGTLSAQSTAHNLRQSSPVLQSLPQINNVAQAKQYYQAALAEALATGAKGLTGAELHSFVQSFNREYLSSSGLAGADLHQRYELAKHVMGVSGSLMYAQQVENIKADLENNKSQLLNTISYKAKTADVLNVGNLAQEVSRLTVGSNIGYGKQGRPSNEFAIKSLLGQLAELPDAEAIIDTLYAEEMSPGRTWGQEFDQEFDAAKELAKKTNDANRADLLKGILGERDRLLNQLDDEKGGSALPSERLAIVDATIRKLERNGFYTEARQLRDKRETYFTNSQSVFNYYSALEDIEDGSLNSKEEVDRRRKEGWYTEEQANKLKTELKRREDLDRTEVKDEVKASTDGFKIEFLDKAGLKESKEFPGQYIPAGKDDTPALTPTQAQNVINAYQKDLENMLLKIIDQNPNAKGKDLDKLLNEAVRSFNQDNVRTQGGLYYIPNTGQQLGAKGMENYLANFKALPDRIGERYSLSARYRSQPWKMYVEKGEDLPDNVRAGYRPNRGDQLYEKAEVKALAEAWKQGQTPKGLAVWADQLGMSPHALLNDQLRSYGLEQVRPQFQASIPTAPITSPIEGAQYLMTRHNLPLKGAAWLAGNIMQESSWRGQQPYWTLKDGAGQNGGLVSWNRSRLSAIEAAAGRPLTQVPTGQQLDLMMNEMRTKYPSAYAIFTNPKATDRQMLRASAIYWGYGEEGERAGYAAQYEAKLRAMPTAKPAGSGQARIVALGQKLTKLKVGGIWQHPNFDVNKGYVAAGNAPVGTHRPGSNHYDRRAFDLAESHNSLTDLNSAFDYMVANMNTYGIIELYWDKRGYYRDGKLIAKAKSNAVPGHDTHIHVAVSK